MLQFLVFMLLFVLVVVIVAVAVVVLGIRRGISRLRQAVGGKGQANGRQSAQGAASPGSQQRSSRYGGGGETITDTRPPQVANRRIFADDEGEYVSFKEMG